MLEKAPVFLCLILFFRKTQRKRDHFHTPVFAWPLFWPLRGWKQVICFGPKGTKSTEYARKDIQIWLVRALIYCSMRFALSFFMFSAPQMKWQPTARSSDGDCMNKSKDTIGNNWNKLIWALVRKRSQIRRRSAASRVNKHKAGYRNRYPAFCCPDGSAA